MNRPPREELLAELTEQIVRFGLHEHSGLIYEVGTRVADKFDPSRSPSFLKFVIASYKFHCIDLYRQETHRGRDKRVYEPIKDRDVCGLERDRDWSIPEVPSCLNANESRVWKMLASGLTQRHIASRMGKSESMVSLYIRSIETKVAPLFGRTPRTRRRAPLRKLTATTFQNGARNE